MACLGFVTFLPLRPLFSLPLFISCISRSTFLPALGLYLRPVLFFEDFFAEDFFADEDDDFLCEDRVEDFLEADEDLPDRDEDFLLELFFEDFFAAFFVAMALPPINDWRPTKRS